MTQGLQTLDSTEGYEHFFGGLFKVLSVDGEVVKTGIFDELSMSSWDFNKGIYKVLLFSKKGLSTLKYLAN